MSERQSEILSIRLPRQYAEWLRDEMGRRPGSERESGWIYSRILNAFMGEQPDEHARLEAEVERLHVLMAEAAVAWERCDQMLRDAGYQAMNRESALRALVENAEHAEAELAALREAAQAVVDSANGAWQNIVGPTALNRLRAALTRPEEGR
jgi:hypothetical protein